jgi:hypothetical protein
MSSKKTKGGFAAHLFSTNAYDKEAKDIWSAVVQGEVEFEDVESVCLLCLFHRNFVRAIDQQTVFFFFFFSHK